MKKAPTPKERKAFFINVICRSFQGLVMIFPVPLSVPLMVVTIPPSVVRIPAAFALGVQISPAIVCLVTALAVFANRFIKFCFPLFDFMLALGVVVCVHLGYGDQRGRA
jgi:hypothetical protein